LDEEEDDDDSGTTTVGPGSAAGGGAGSGHGAAPSAPLDRSFHARRNCSLRSRPLIGSKK
jgi:hypothetical protein